MGRDRPEVAGIVGNRFAITLLGNLTSVYKFIMFFIQKKTVVRFFSKQHGSKQNRSFMQLQKYEFSLIFSRLFIRFFQKRFLNASFAEICSFGSFVWDIDPLFAARHRARNLTAFFRALFC